MAKKKPAPKKAPRKKKPAAKKAKARVRKRKPATSAASRAGTGRGNRAGVGRGVWQPAFVNIALGYCLLGLTNKELAVAFEVSEATIYSWIKDRPEFKAALEGGRKKADVAVAVSLRQRALGYDITVEKAMWDKVQGRHVIIETKKTILPNVTAQIFWLKNRFAAIWRDVQKLADEDGGSSGTPAAFADHIAGALELKAFNEGREIEEAEWTEGSNGNPDSGNGHNGRGPAA